jgi:hypothetical protein
MSARIWWGCAGTAAVMAVVVAFPTSAQAEPEIVQTAVVDEDYGYLNLSQRGGRPTGPGVDGDGPPPLQAAAMTAVFSDFALNGIEFEAWSACRTTSSVDECLVDLIGDRDGDGTIGLRDLHPGDIGGDTFTFDVTITNTSPPGGPVLTAFAFQSKFSESPALGSRIGDKLFSAERVGYEGPATGLIGVKKNGTANGLFGGKVKAICINSSDDYPQDLNLGDANETLECAGGRTFDRDTNRPVLQAADGDVIDPANIDLPKGLLPGQSMVMTLELDAGTDDGALQRAYAPSCDDLTGDAQVACKAATGPLMGTLANLGEPIAADNAAACLELDPQPGDNVLEIVNFGDVKIIRDSDGNCSPSFDPLSKNQFLTIPRRNWGFTDVLDTRDTYILGELPSVLTGATGQFSFLDFGQLRPGEMNFFEILRGFGEFGETLDPSCAADGSRAGSCGGAPYVPWGEFYAVADGQLVRQEVAGVYGPADYSDGPTLTATIDTAGQTTCRGAGLAVTCKTTDPFEIPGTPNPGPAIGAAANATFSDVVVIADDKTTIENEGGQAGGNRVQFTVEITNTSPTGSGIYLTSFNFQTKRRGLTDINQLDGTTIQGRQDLRTGPAGPLLPVCGDDPLQAQCLDTDLGFTRDDGTVVPGIGRFPNVLGNSLLSSTAVSGLDPTGLNAIKKNGTFQPLTRNDDGVANYICIKSGPQAADQDADEVCSGTPTDSSGAPLGLAPGESQSVRLEMDYGDFRGLVTRVAPGTLADYSVADAPFGLIALRGDFDCRDQRRLPYCHPNLNGTDWFATPSSLNEVEFVTVHQPGNAATVMNFEQNFGVLLAMAGFSPTAEFWQGGTQLQVNGTYLNLPGGGVVEPPPPDPGPAPNQLPTAVIATPACEDLTCTFDGSGSTDPDGTVVSHAWRFFAGDTEVGEASGAVVDFTFLDAGTYTARLLVTDDRGGTGAAEATVTVTAPPPTPQLSLSVTAFKVRGLQTAQLDWSGTTAAQVDVYRGTTTAGTLIRTVNNTGRYIDNINRRGSGTYTYKVCEAGTAVCSAEVTVRFT